MNLAYSKLFISLEFEENNTNVLVLESPSIFGCFLRDLKNQLDGMDSGFYLANQEEIPVSKNIELVFDPWAIDFNSKKIKNRLFSIVEEEASSRFLPEYYEMRGKIYEYMEQLLEMIPYNIKYNFDLDIVSLLKYVNIEIDLDECDLLELISEYIRLISQMGLFKIITFCNLKSFLSSEQMKLLYQEASNCKIHLLLLENMQREKIEGEKYTVVDKDCCIINY